LPFHVTYCPVPQCNILIGATILAKYKSFLCLLDFYCYSSLIQQVRPSRDPVGKTPVSNLVAVQVSQLVAHAAQYVLQHIGALRLGYLLEQESGQIPIVLVEQVMSLRRSGVHIVWPSNPLSHFVSPNSATGFQLRQMHAYC
jgi:hypothetical protein